MTPGTRLLEAVRDALTYKGAPDICEDCKNAESSCQRYNDCDCPLSPSCHTVRVQWINERRDALLAEIDVALRTPQPSAEAADDLLYAARNLLSVLDAHEEYGRTSDRSGHYFCGSNEEDRVFDAKDALLAELESAHALYPAAHALGARVSVVYPPEKHPEYEDFTGTVVGVEFHTDGVDYRVKGDADPDYTVVDAAFVHSALSPYLEASAPASQTATIGESHPWAHSPRASTSWFPMDGRRVTEGSPASSIADVQKTTFDPAVHGNGVPGFGPVTSHDVTSTHTCVIPGRSKTTTFTDVDGTKTTETVDLRDPADLHARFGEALGQEWRKLEGDKDVRHEWLAAFERAAEIAEGVWPRTVPMEATWSGPYQWEGEDVATIGGTAPVTLASETKFYFLRFIAPGGRLVVAIDIDGKVTGSALDNPDEAARAFWSAVEAMAPKRGQL